MVYKRLLLLILLPLISAAALAGEAEILANPGSASYRSNSGSASEAGKIRLKGVLVSESGGLALINGKLSRVGDRVAGAEIVAISEGAVRLSMGSRERTLYVGSSFVPGQSVQATGSRLRGQLERRSAEVASRSKPESADQTRAERHAVARGETLSGISEHYSVQGVTLNQMMLAMFRANPDAFADNINLLRAGASLRIPNRAELLHEVPEAATAEVTRQTNEWQTRYQLPTRLVEALEPTQYGPVSGGETLSGIAKRVSPKGVTIDQMMIALYEANREAFGDNINILYEGSVLRMPADDELRQRPEIATAEVIRQTDAWRAAVHRPSPSTLPYESVTASADALLLSENQATP